MDLNKLNCMNYHVYESETGDNWYAQNGLRSIFEYSKISGATFRELCKYLDNNGEITIRDNRTGNELTLSMI